uniref:RING-type domain-containing protein n=1 Tax=Kalanchoe fedtschenkoi TaxID=63787 RepID=A0A7N0VFG8_KALFE
MEDVTYSINPTAPPPPPPALGDNLPMMYYGLVVVGTVTAVLAIYNLIIIWWCTGDHRSESGRASGESGNPATHLSSSKYGSSFKYKKGPGLFRDVEHDDGEHMNVEYECCVCLSAFEDGEEVRELGRCKHSFHAQCIDMWLYSHLDCPLCRQGVEIAATSHQDALSINSDIMV